MYVKFEIGRGKMGSLRLERGNGNSGARGVEVRG